MVQLQLHSDNIMSAQICGSTIITFDAEYSAVESDNIVEEEPTTTTLLDHSSSRKTTAGNRALHWTVLLIPLPTPTLCVVTPACLQTYICTSCNAQIKRSIPNIDGMLLDASLQVLCCLLKECRSRNNLVVSHSAKCMHCLVVVICALLIQVQSHTLLNVCIFCEEERGCSVREYLEKRLLSTQHSSV